MLTPRKVLQKIGQRTQLIERVAHDPTCRRIGVHVAAVCRDDDNAVPRALDHRRQRADSELSRGMHCATWFLVHGCLLSQEKASQRQSGRPLQSGGAARPSRIAHSAAWVLELRPSLARMLLTCVLAVRSLITSSPAIS